MEVESLWVGAWFSSGSVLHFVQPVTFVQFANGIVPQYVLSTAPKNIDLKNVITIFGLLLYSRTNSGQS